MDGAVRAAHTDTRLRARAARAASVGNRPPAAPAGARAFPGQRPRRRRARDLSDRHSAVRTRGRVRRRPHGLLARVGRSMRITIWGCRGSLPTPGPETVGYGGNTSCVEVSLPDGSLLVLDAGSGIRKLGDALADREVRRFHLLLTHLHLDHVEGLRFFAPLFDERTTLDIWGPPSPVLSLEDRILRSFSPPL